MNRRATRIMGAMCAAWSSAPKLEGHLLMG
jgi:hypothetical protein